MALIASVSGIRGTFGDGLDPQNLVQYAAAFGQWIRQEARHAVAGDSLAGESNRSGDSRPSGQSLKAGENPVIIVGRDSRVTGEICEHLVTATLRSLGIDVITLGIVPTPTVAMAVLHYQAKGGIILSASHNPAEWNALKLLNHRSEFLDPAQGAEVLALLDAGVNVDWASWDQTGVLSADTEAIERHIEAILAHPWIDREAIRQAGFTVAVDAVNGAGSEAIPALLTALGVKVHALHCTPDGYFPHNPEPLAEHLGEICAFVQEHRVDLGVVTDPDADRLALVSEQGDLFGEEYTQAIAFDWALERAVKEQKAGSRLTVATNLSSSRIADWVAEKHGATCVRSAVGEIHVVKAMQTHDAVMGGEGNGGVIDPQLHYGRDALMGVAIVLHQMASKKMSASECRASYPTFVMSKQKRALADLGMDTEPFLEKVANAFAHLSPNTVDGVKLDFEHGWVHMRTSNTEPIIRFYSEAPSAAEAEALIQHVLSEVDG
ncbi:MAG TPA: phosphoglucosamine mutase [Bacteroidetes bacterium]|nr:phosphoglucosamine mutase [Bacteroidota bacterium]